jgi:chaperonin GroES
MKNIRPVEDFILIEFKPVEEEITESGIVIPDSAKKEKHYAVIVSIGPKVEHRDYKIGNKVIFNDYDLKTVETTDRRFGLLRAGSIFAVYE